MSLLATELNTCMSRDDIINMYNSCTEKPFGFLSKSTIPHRYPRMRGVFSLCEKKMLKVQSLHNNAMRKGLSFLRSFTDSEYALFVPFSRVSKYSLSNLGDEPIGLK